MKMFAMSGSFVLYIVEADEINRIKRAEDVLICHSLSVRRLHR